MSAQAAHHAPRQRQLAELLGIIETPGSPGVVVHAAFGSGQVEFVQQLMQVATDTRQFGGCLRLRGISGQEEIAFGTLMGVLEQTFAPADYAQVVRVLDERFGELAGHAKNRLLVILEDVQYLDEATVFALTQMVQAQRIALAVFSPDPLGQLPNLDPLTGLGDLPVVHLGALARHEVATMIHQASAVPPTAGCLDCVYALSGGIHELAVQLIERIGARGLWNHLAGYSTFAVEQLESDSALLESIWQALQDLDQAEVELLSLLAMLGKMPRQEARSGFDDALSRLERRGLVRTDPEDCTRPAARLVPQAIRRFIRPGQVRRLAGLWQEWNAANGLAPSWRATYWALMAGQPVVEAQIVEAARQANMEGHFDMALQLALVQDQAPSVSRRIQALYALGGLRRLPECRAGMEALLDHVLVPSQVRELTAAWLMVLAHDFDYANHYGQAARLWSALRAGPDAADPQLEHRIGLATLIAGRLRPGEFAQQLRHFLDAAMEPDVRLVATIAGLENRALDFDDERVTGLLQEYGSVLPRSLIRRADVAREVLRAEQLPLESNEADIEARLEQLGGDEYLRSAIRGCLAGLRSERQGDYQRSRTLLLHSTLDFLAAHMPEYARFSLWRYYLLTPGSSVDPRLDGAVGLRRPGATRGPALYRINNAVLELLAGTAHESGALAPAAATAALEESEPSEALDQLWHLARFLDTDPVTTGQHVSNRVPPLERTQGEAEKLIHRLLVAGTKDATTLSAVRERAEQLGLHSIAAAAGAFILLADTAPDTARGAAMRYLYSRDFSQGRCRLLDRAMVRHGLSQRELEIAHLVSNGMSNKEVARQLSLSVRTVEGHVYRVLNKFGFQQRSALSGLEGLESYLSSSASPHYSGKTGN